VLPDGLYYQDLAKMLETEIKEDLDFLVDIGLIQLEDEG